MIVPTKHLPIERSLLGVGADILSILDRPKTISRLWADLKTLRGQSAHRIPFDWFVLSISMLFSIEAIDINRGRLEKRGAT
jgi:hypothetical protein